MLIPPSHLLTVTIQIVCNYRSVIYNYLGLVTVQVNISNRKFGTFQSVVGNTFGVLTKAAQDCLLFGHVTVVRDVYATHPSG